MLKDVLKNELLTIKFDISKIDLCETMAAGVGCGKGSSCSGSCSGVQVQ